uniref:Uncharacterized protein n=1 Tax=Oryza brachyantha TaxID=4533 RepID=J3L8G1_ORYBR
MTAKQSKIIMLHSRKLTMSIGPTITLNLFFSFSSKATVEVIVSLSTSGLTEPPLKKVYYSFTVTSVFNVINSKLSFFPI